MASVKGFSSSKEAGDSSFDGETESATKMALISESIKTAPGTNQAFPASTTAQLELSTDHSSQDTTLHQLKEQTRSAKAQGSSKSKRQKMGRKPSRRDALLRKESFAKDPLIHFPTRRPHSQIAHGLVPYV